MRLERVALYLGSAALWRASTHTQAMMHAWHRLHVRERARRRCYWSGTATAELIRVDRAPVALLVATATAAGRAVHSLSCTF
jgi:hypothetical protein